MSQPAVCIVTGAAAGLGAAITAGLLEAGHRVVATDIKPSETHAKYRDSGRLIEIAADVSSASDSSNVIEACLKDFGSVDVLVNNAGICAGVIRPNYVTQPVETGEGDAQIWAKIVQVNLIGTIMMTHFAIPHLKNSPRGRIINLSTTWETMLRVGFASYGASKAGIEAFSHAMAKELAGKVTVNTIFPGGPADTAQVPDDIGIPRDKLLRPDVMVPPILWLMSEEADHITGKRFSAAMWDQAKPLEERLESASEPAAWPQLHRPMVMQARGNLRS